MQCRGCENGNEMKLVPWFAGVRIAHMGKGPQLHMQCHVNSIHHLPRELGLITADGWIIYHSFQLVPLIEFLLRNKFGLVGYFSFNPL